jgi:hypothetical protein
MKRGRKKITFGLHKFRHFACWWVCKMSVNDGLRSVLRICYWLLPVPLISRLRRKGHYSRAGDDFVELATAKFIESVHSNRVKLWLICIINLLVKKNWWRWWCLTLFWFIWTPESPRWDLREKSFLFWCGFVAAFGWLRATKVVITLGNVGVDDANHLGRRASCLSGCCEQRNVHEALERILFLSEWLDLRVWNHLLHFRLQLWS